jgi:hypothetical protein
MIELLQSRPIEGFSGGEYLDVQHEQKGVGIEHQRGIKAAKDD